MVILPNKALVTNFLDELIRWPNTSRWLCVLTGHHCRPLWLRNIEIITTIKHTGCKKKTCFNPESPTHKPSGRSSAAASNCCCRFDTAVSVSPMTTSLSARDDEVRDLLILGSGVTFSVASWYQDQIKEWKYNRFPLKESWFSLDTMSFFLFGSAGTAGRAGRALNSLERRIAAAFRAAVTSWSGRWTNH